MSLECGKHGIMDDTVREKMSRQCRVKGCRHMWTYADGCPSVWNVW